MSFIIGFHPQEEKNKDIKRKNTQTPKVCAKKSLVKVRFDGVYKEYSYYNDLFDLKVGDLVFVEGCLEDKRGTVTEVSYNFKIKLSDYKKIIAVADTTISGELLMTREHFISFERNTLPFSKISSWFVPPVKEGEEIVESEDDKTFLLRDLKGLNASLLVFERGEEYYFHNKVVYLQLDGEQGRAIVQGTRAYVVEFRYKNGEISKLRCDCFCVGACKHEVAVMLQLTQLLDIIEKDFSDKYNNSNYFSAIFKPTLFMHSVFSKSKGKIVL